LSFVAYKSIPQLLSCCRRNQEDDGVIGHDKILNSMKEVIRQDPSVPLKLIYDSVNRHHVRRGGGDREHIPEFHREKCHSKWHSNSNDTHVYILQKIHTGIRTM
jgi:hypothetical protein